MENELIKQLLEMNTQGDFRYSDLVHNALVTGIHTVVDNEEEILDCAELFSIENVIKNRHGRMFVYGHMHDESNVSIDIVRARRKIDIGLKYFVNSNSTIEDVMMHIEKYIGDNRAIVLDASIDKGINIAFIKEYKNVDNIVINKEICLLRLLLSTTNSNERQLPTDISLAEKLRVVASKIYHAFLSSEFMTKANVYMDELKSNYLAKFAHIYSDTLDKFFQEHEKHFILTKEDAIYSIQKELAICDFVTEQALKVEQFKNHWNNFINIEKYNKVLEFALKHAYVTRNYHDTIITACLFFFYNIDKITMNLAREAKGNESIQTTEDIEAMYIKAIDIALITSKDVLAAILDNEKIEIKIEPSKALELLKIYNLETELLSSFKDEILNPIINVVIDDVLDFKLEEKAQAEHKQLRKEEAEENDVESKEDDALSEN